MSDQRCATCDRSIYFRGIKDHVGRQTSQGEWVHFGGTDTGVDHPARPKASARP